MSKVAIVYWSSTGNTAEMGKKLNEYLNIQGADTDVFEADNFSSDKMNEYDAIAFGCPAMGAEQLEESEFEPMFNNCEQYLKGKKIGLFGSYGWGDGEWMQTWQEICINDGANIVCDGVICNDEPDDDTFADLESMAKELV